MSDSPGDEDPAEDMEDADAEVDLSVGDLPAVETRVSRTGRRKVVVSEEFVRAGLALAFTAIFLVTVIISSFGLGESSWDNTSEWLQILLPAQTALIGSATGFYFGTKRNS